MLTDLSGVGVAGHIGTGGGIGEIVQGAVDAGLVVANLREHFFADWQAYPSMIEVEPGKYVLPEAPERVPLLFTLIAEP